MSAKKSVLIVEDDRSLGGAMELLLKLEGYEVQSAENGKSALDKLLGAGAAPDCIVLDLMMPVMGGKAFLEVLAREHPGILARAPVLLTTAKGNFRPETEKLAAPVEFLPKPFEMNEFLSVVGRLCG